MVTETLNADNQLSVNPSNLPKTKTIRMTLRKKHTHCSKNLRSQTKPSSPPIVTNKCFTVFHQNIRGLRDKTNELLGTLLPNLPHVVCLTEHHLTEQELDILSIAHYTPGAKFCRTNLKHGGTGIFIHESLAYTNIDLQKFCTEQDIETCAIKINLPTAYIYVIGIYRSPTGNYTHFIICIDTILDQLYKQNVEIIVCGDININCLDENCNKRRQLDALLATYNLISTVQFPTRSLNGSVSAIDNIFIDKSHTGKYTIDPFITGLSDHDGQIIKLGNISMQNQLHETRTIRIFNKCTIHDFMTKLSYETWGEYF
jgi:exonuclease III